MGSSWRYRHVAITHYSIRGFHGLACMFSKGSHVLFLGLAFLYDGRAREFTRTLESGIEVGPTVINLAFFSRPYGLIRDYIKVI